nr:unnamed protein product [Digitaria exilis]
MPPPRPRPCALLRLPTAPQQGQCLGGSSQATTTFPLCSPKYKYPTDDGHYYAEITGMQVGEEAVQTLQSSASGSRQRSCRRSRSSTRGPAAAYPRHIAAPRRRARAAVAPPHGRPQYHPGRRSTAPTADLDSPLLPGGNTGGLLPAAAELVAPRRRRRQLACHSHGARIIVSYYFRVTQ